MAPRPKSGQKKHKNPDKQQCSDCGDLGHIAEDCPDRCQRCGGKGHTHHQCQVFICPECKRMGDRCVNGCVTETCQRCSGKHPTAECFTRICDRCVSLGFAGFGHLAVDCKRPVCDFCGKANHARSGCYQLRCAVCDGHGHDGSEYDPCHVPKSQWSCRYCKRGGHNVSDCYKLSQRNEQRSRPTLAEFLPTPKADPNSYAGVAAGLRLASVLVDNVAAGQTATDGAAATAC